jgi:hypothetical protein
MDRARDELRGDDVASPDMMIYNRFSRLVSLLHRYLLEFLSLRVGAHRPDALLVLPYDPPQ